MGKGQRPSGGARVTALLQPASRDYARLPVHFAPDGQEYLAVVLFNGTSIHLATAVDPLLHPEQYRVRAVSDPDDENPRYEAYDPAAVSASRWSARTACHFDLRWDAPAVPEVLGTLHAFSPTSPKQCAWCDDFLKGDRDDPRGPDGLPLEHPHSLTAACVAGITSPLVSACALLESRPRESAQTKAALESLLADDAAAQPWGWLEPAGRGPAGSPFIVRDAPCTTTYGLYRLGVPAGVIARMTSERDKRVQVYALSRAATELGWFAEGALLPKGFSRTPYGLRIGQGRSALEVVDPRFIAPSPLMEEAERLRGMSFASLADDELDATRGQNEDIADALERRYNAAFSELATDAGRRYVLEALSKERSTYEHLRWMNEQIAAEPSRRRRVAERLQTTYPDAGGRRCLAACFQDPKSNLRDGVELYSKGGQLLRLEISSLGLRYTASRWRSGELIDWNAVFPSGTSRRVEPHNLFVDVRAKK